MDASESNALLPAFGVFTGIFLFLTLVQCLRGSSALAAIIRLLSLIPYGIYGGTAIKYAFKHRADESTLPGARTAFVSEGVHGIVGILLVPYAFVVFVILAQTQEEPKLEWNAATLERRARNFYLFIIDWIFILGIATAIGLEHGHVPWRLTTCFNGSFDDPLLEALPGGTLIDACRGRYTIKVMGFVTIFNVAAQSLLLVPIACYPTLLRASHRLLARYTRPAAYRPLSETKSSDHEKRPDSAVVPGQTHPFENMFQNEKVASNVARQLHFQDILNICGVSKTLHETSQYPMGNDESTRKERLYEMACIDGSKSQCWACSAMVCTGCKEMKKGLPHPRTMAHLTDCYAICTPCYLLRTKTSPAPFSATWDATNLAIQHASCAHDANKVRPKTDWVDLFSSCSKLGEEEIVKMVEERQIRTMARLMSSRMRCKECEVMLAKGKRRWWICASGSHECHWAGHEYRV